jgi:hypothetical protein
MRGRPILHAPHGLPGGLGGDFFGAGSRILVKDCVKDAVYGMRYIHNTIGAMPLCEQERRSSFPRTVLEVYKL